MSDMLEIDRLDVLHGEIAVIHALSLEVRAGEIVALLGPNGAGKTTLLRAISGLHPVAGGSIRFAGRSLTNRRPHRIARAGVAHVPEGRGILGDLTVMENLRLGAYAAGGLRDGAIRDHVFSLFPRLAERHGQLAGLLSGGEQQMLAIGRSLLGNPRLLLIDELSLGLAPRIAGELLHLLARLASEGLGVLLVEQNVRETLKVATRACVLVQGRAVFQGAAHALATPEMVMELYLGRQPDRHD